MPASTRVTRTTATFGCLNIRSLLNKFDDVDELYRDRHVDILCLTESWHDTDSAVLGRLRSAGYSVVDRPRPRLTDDMSVNHGGIVVIARGDDVFLSPITIADQPTTFEAVCVRAVIGRFTAVVVALYRPGSVAVQQKFYDELAAILDRVATYQDPVYIVGDFNIRLDRPDDPHTEQLQTMVECYGLKLHATGPTHQLGGTLDAVITHTVTGQPEYVAVEDVGLSDHLLLRWVVSTTRDTPSLVTVTSRPWRQLDMELFRSSLSVSRLCRPDDWCSDIDQLAALYDDELNSVLDQLLPVRQFVRRQRPTDPWFDKDCRAAKRRTRRLERAFAAASRRATDPACSDITAAAAKVTSAKEAWYSERRSYRQLRHRKATEFWQAKLQSDSDPRRTWRSVDVLLGRGRVPASTAIDVETFNRFFVDKVAKVRSSTSDAPPPVYSSLQSGVSFRQFSPLTIDDVVDAVRRLPDKSSATDPIPTNVLKQIIDLIAPYIVELFNRSLAAGHFPVGFKDAFITPVIKKPGLDDTDVSSYRPISNLSVLSKLLERLVARQLMAYLSSSDLLPSLQSGFRPGHSVETAVLRVLSDILNAVDLGDVAALILLDMSAAFDTVDHRILLQRLQSTFGIHDTVHQWFRSYLSGRRQCVRRGYIKSLITTLVCGVPQGSVLGPVLFVMYTVDLIQLIERHGLVPHLYADDTQVYGFCPPSATSALSTTISECLDDVVSWASSNRLQLNPMKTEVMWCATSRRQDQLPSSTFQFSGASVSPVKSVRDLGIHIDSDLSMRTHILRTVSRCFGALRQLRQIRRSVPTATLQMLVVRLVLSRLDFGNSVLVGIPTCLLCRLQSVMNAGARLIFHLRRSDHITDALLSLHWLRVPERIQYKIAVLTYKVLHGTAPRYLGPLDRVTDQHGRRALRSASSGRLMVPRFRLSTVGSRAFNVSGPRIWNGLPDEVVSAPTLSSFRRRLKPFLFQQSYPDIVI